MTTLELYIALQYDLNKLEAPSILVDEFNHFVNKAQTQYTNKKYNVFASKQQYTDDLQAFTKTVIIDNNGKITNRKGDIIGSTSIVDTYLGQSIALPSDYIHTLGVIVDTGICSPKTARRLTVDINGGIQDNAYLSPSAERPYFFISDDYLEIRTGKVKFKSFSLDYLSQLDKIKLTEQDIEIFNETGKDQSNQLPYADYIAYEILKELTALILEMTSDPRLNTNTAVTTSIN